MTFYVLKFITEIQKYIYILYDFCHIEMVPVQKSFLMEDKDLFIPLNQLHDCWCPGDLCHQDISSHGIDQVLLK